MQCIGVDSVKKKFEIKRVALILKSYSVGQAENNLK